MFYSITTTWKWRVMVMKSKEHINQILKYIEEHLDEELSCTILAKEAGYSEYYFIRNFKMYMGVTVMEYIGKRRLVKASEDILEGNKILDVALKYGWQSHSGFTKAFQREFGFSPSLLRTMSVSIKDLGGMAMNHVFLESTKIGTAKEELFEILKCKMQENGIIYDDSLLALAYENACNVYSGVKRYSGEEYVTHGLNISILLVELGADINTILAGMFCDIKEKGILPFENLENKLPKDILHIIKQVQIATNELDDNSDEVIQIKMAERLHNMRTIEFMDKRKIPEKVQETIEVFMPFARKLGNKKLVDELTDLCMKYR